MSLAFLYYNSNKIMKIIIKHIALPRSGVCACYVLCYGNAASSELTTLGASSHDNKKKNIPAVIQGCKRGRIT